MNPGEEGSSDEDTGAVAGVKGDTIHCMIRFQFPQGHPMARVAYAPDSLEVFTAHPQTGVFGRDRFTGRTVRELLLPNVAWYSRLAVSTCGRYLGVGGGGRVFAYDLASRAAGALVQERVIDFALVERRLRCIFRRRGDTLAADMALDPPDGVILGIGTNLDPVALKSTGSVIAVSPNGRVGVAVRQRGKPQLVEFLTGQTVGELNFPLRRANENLIGFAVFAPTGTRLALCDGEKLGLFDLSAEDWSAIPTQPRQLHPECELERPDPTAGGTAKDQKAKLWLPPFAFTPDGRHFLTLGLRERVQLFDARVGKVVEQWGWRMEDVTCLAVAPDGLTACAGGRRGRMTVWDLC